MVFFKVLTLIVLIFLSTRHFIKLWKCNHIIEEVKSSCNWRLHSIPESEICTLSYMPHQELVDTICDNECFDLYGPGDKILFQKITLCDYNWYDCRVRVCKVLKHIDETPFARCLKSNKYLCDSFTGYFSWRTEAIAGIFGLGVMYKYMNPHKEREIIVHVIGDKISEGKTHHEYTYTYGVINVVSKFFDGKFFEKK